MDHETDLVTEQRISMKLTAFQGSSIHMKAFLYNQKLSVIVGSCFGIPVPLYTTRGLMCSTFEAAATIAQSA
jgi:hypothetical protein